jgi:hypothetical protein
MNHFLSKVSALVLIVLFVMVSFSFSAQAEKKKITYSKKSKQFVSVNTVSPGDVPNRELLQAVRIDVVTSPDPDFNGEHVVYIQIDQVAGTGSHRGYTVFNHKNGDKSYASWEGTHKTIVKEGGSWETPFEGKGQLIGGTGKFKDVKGTLTYKGKITPEGLTEEGEYWVEE